MASIISARRSIWEEDVKKIYLVGEAGAGKNCLMTQFCAAVFANEEDPFHGETQWRRVDLDGERTALSLLGVDVSRARRTILDHYYTDADGFMVVYSVCSRSSLEKALEACAWLKWLSEVVKKEACPPLMLVGTQKDRDEEEREVTEEEGRRVAADVEVGGFGEVSARDEDEVSDVFNQLVRLMRMREAPTEEELRVARREEAKRRTLINVDEKPLPLPPHLQQQQQQQQTQQQRSKGKFRSWGRSRLRSSARKEEEGSFEGSRQVQLQEDFVAAVKRNDEKAFVAHMQAGANVDGRSKGETGTVVHIAAKAGHERILQILIEKGVGGINFPDAEGTPPLQLAAMEGREGTVRLLLENGVDIDQTSPKYGTALSAAAYCGRQALVELLLERGADVAVRSTMYGDALQDIAKSNNGLIVATLQARARRADEENEKRLSGLIGVGEDGMSDRGSVSGRREEKKLLNRVLVKAQEKSKRRFSFTGSLEGRRSRAGTDDGRSGTESGRVSRVGSDDDLSQHSPQSQHQQRTRPLTDDGLTEKTNRWSRIEKEEKRRSRAATLENRWSRASKPREERWSRVEKEAERMAREDSDDQLKDEDLEAQFPKPPRMFHDFTPRSHTPGDRTPMDRTPMDQTPEEQLYDDQVFQAQVLKTQVLKAKLLKAKATRDKQESRERELKEQAAREEEVREKAEEEKRLREQAARDQELKEQAALEEELKYQELREQENAREYESPEPAEITTPEEAERAFAATDTRSEVEPFEPEPKQRQEDNDEEPEPELDHEQWQMEDEEYDVTPVVQLHSIGEEEEEDYDDDLVPIVQQLHSIGEESEEEVEGEEQQQSIVDEADSFQTALTHEDQPPSDGEHSMKQSDDDEAEEEAERLVQEHAEEDGEEDEDEGPSTATLSDEEQETTSTPIRWSLKLDLPSDSFEIDFAKLDSWGSLDPKIEDGV